MDKFDELVSLLPKFIDVKSENIFINAISEEADSTGQDTLILLSEDLSNPDGYADDTFNEYRQGLTITIFYGFQYPRKFEIDEIRLQKQLINDGWLISSSQAHYLDPTTQQSIKNITIERTQGLDEI